MDPRFPRLASPDRNQQFFRPTSLDELLPEDHTARSLWLFVERLDLSALYARVRARGSVPGRPAIDPRILLTLWLYATSEGVGSARRLARLCEEHDAYRWICGGVGVNYHTLSDFRSERAEEFDDLLTQHLAVLLHQGVLSLERVAQDGIRVRACAGASSFRRGPTLEKCRAEARHRVEEAKKEADEPEPGITAREKAARERAARERLERIERALEELPKAREAKRSRGKQDEARTSTTDPEARVMKMGDGGYRPAFNVQFATDTVSRTIVGVQADNLGSDTGHLQPMLDEIQRRAGKLPKEILVDGGYVNLQQFQDAADRQVTVYAPPPETRNATVDPFVPKERDTEGVAAWRVRMGTEAAKEIYKQRAATAETVHADLRAWRGWGRFLVRGARKVLGVALLGALTYNALRHRVPRPNS